MTDGNISAGVCEWADRGKKWVSQCKRSFDAFASSKGRFFCQGCGRPISFQKGPMTLSDLEKIYGAAYWSRPEMEPDGARRAGIAAVVLALRGEMYCSDDVCKLEEILASREDGPAEGVPALKDDSNTACVSPSAGLKTQEET